MVTTLPQLLVHSVTSYPKPDLMLFKKAGAYTPISSAEFGASVKHLALGLRALGFETGQKLCILSENRPAWSTTATSSRASAPQPMTRTRDGSGARDARAAGE